MVSSTDCSRNWLQNVQYLFLQLGLKLKSTRAQVIEGQITYQRSAVIDSAAVQIRRVAFAETCH